MYIPDELWLIIINYQTKFEDYNPMIFNKQYQKCLKQYIRTTNWEN